MAAIAHAGPPAFLLLSAEEVALYHECICTTEVEPAESCAVKMTPEGTDAVTLWIAKTHSTWAKDAGGNLKPPCAKAAKTKEARVLLALYLRYNLAVPPNPNVTPPVLMPTVRPNARRKMLYIWNKMKLNLNIPSVRGNLLRTGGHAAGVWAISLFLSLSLLFSNVPSRFCRHVSDSFFLHPGRALTSATTPRAAQPCCALTL